MMANAYGGDLYVVNAYRDSLYYPDRGQLANESDLDGSKVHVEQGFTSEVIAVVSREINADLGMIGTLNQIGKESTLRDDAAERVISFLDVDTVVANSKVRLEGWP